MDGTSSAESEDTHVALLTKWAEDAFWCVKKNAQLPQFPDLPPGVPNWVTDHHVALQTFFETLIARQQTVATPSQVGLPGVSKEIASELNLDDLPEGTGGSLGVSKPRAKRRKSDSAFDYTVLEFLKQREAFGHDIGQQAIFKLVSEIDPDAKFKSVVAQLGRWKNEEDKRWIVWTDPERISLLPAGDDRRKELLDLVKRDRRLDEVRRAFKAAWNFELGEP